MVSQIAIVVERHLASVANERSLKGYVLWCETVVRADGGLPRRLGVKYLFEGLRRPVQSRPNIAEFSDSPKGTAFELIEEMAEGVGRFDKVRGLDFDGKLYLSSDEVIELDVH